MPSMTAPTRTNGSKAPSDARPAGARGRPAARRRQLPLVVVGVLLVIGGALAFADASLHLGSREEVLVVSEPLAAGQVITSSDLETVRVSTGSGLQVVPVGDEASVVGSPVAVPLVAGSLLTRAEVGSTAPVASGSDVVAVGLKAGQYPPDLAPGDRVRVVPVTSPSSSSLTPPGVRFRPRCWPSTWRRLNRTARLCSPLRCRGVTRTRWRRSQLPTRRA